MKATEGFRKGSKAKLVYGLCRCIYFIPILRCSLNTKGHGIPWTRFSPSFPKSPHQCQPSERSQPQPSSAPQAPGRAMPGRVNKECL